MSVVFNFETTTQNMKKIFTPLAIAVISCSANAQSLSSGLLMRFNFAGNAKDAGPYALATSPSALTLSADALGKTAQAYSFNGTSDKINVAYNANVQAQFPMTIAAWINMDDSSKAFPIFSNDMSATVYSGASMTVSGAKLSAGIGNGNGVGAQFRSTYESPTLLRSKTWYHVCCVFKGLGIFELYVNGVKVNGSYSGTASSMAYTNSGAAIGFNYSRSAAPHQYAKGKIDNVMYYGRELSELEINLIKDMVLMSEMDATADFGPYENTPTANSLSASKDRFGNNGKAVFFNGSSSQWTYPTNNTYKLSFPFTMGAWVKLDSNNGNRPVFNLSDHINSKYAGAQMVIQGGIPYLNIGDNNGAGIQFRKSYQVNDSIKVGNWYFIVANFISLNSFKIYINGVEKTAGT
ncbi:MAG: laminin G domain-containing protein, partial [Bacteroidia bacterium]|nr:laminin G domain-containing protein [Bacteroidia bacterium]